MRMITTQTQSRTSHTGEPARAADAWLGTESHSPAPFVYYSPPLLGYHVEHLVTPDARVVHVGSAEPATATGRASRVSRS
jgi:hypothetical protein